MDWRAEEQARERWAKAEHRRGMIRGTAVTVAFLIVWIVIAYGTALLVANMGSC